MTTRRITRLVAGLGALLVAAAVPGVARAADSLSFGEQGAKATFGANAIVRIDGTITYASDCPKPGIDDFVYPATDVYLVQAGTGTGELEDAAGGRPNTIVAGASMFLDEVIAVTAPAGSLDEGVYDVVYDTCQDGTFDPGRDTVFEDAVTVRLPDVLPLADGAIRELKDEASREYLSWVATRGAMSGIFNLADRALKAQCKAGNAVGCAMKRVDYFDGVKERFLALLLSQANHYLAIAEDPPDSDFDQATVVAPVSVPQDHGDSALGNATADALRPLAAEAALSRALLQAVERYQGAQAAGNGEWALVHARQARNLARTLRAAVLASGDALDRLRAAAAGRAGELDEELSRGREFTRRVFAEGLAPGERRALLNGGLSAGRVASLETELRASAYAAGSETTSSAALAALDEARAAHAATAAALAASAAEWDGVVAAVEAEDVPDPTPAIAAGGPYAVGEGAELRLQGTAAGPVDAAAWDLDGDGGFDDAAGLEPSASFPRAGTYAIGLRATRDGRESYAYAVVTVADTGRAPVLSSPEPAERLATVVVGDERTFSVAASDPDGGPVEYAWTVDGAATGVAGPSLAFAPTATQVGSHVVEVVASDGTASGGGTRRTWDVLVLAVDGDGDGWTATTDCDEADPAVRPTANELIGNGIDDDCDPGTPDAPPGGLTGSVLSWGSNYNGTVGSGSFSPQIVHTPVWIPGYANVVQVGGDDRSGLAVLATGEVRTWGFNGSGELGDDTTASSAIPVSPLSVGGGPGVLGGVTQASSMGGHVLARRADGSVVAWGENQQSQVGDGSTVTRREYPVEVLTSADGPPLAGVRAVQAGSTDSLALMEDGTVRAWGQMRCDGTVRVEPYPVPLPLVGGDVRQISAGNQFALFLKKDGTVLSCGAAAPVSGRAPTGPPLVPLPVTGLGPGSGVVDVSAGFEGGAALKADGSLWMWGYNANGSLTAAGVAPGGSAPAPVQLQLPPGPPVVDVEMSKACHVLALRADGSVLAWGCDFFGQVGDGISQTGAPVPVPTVIDLQGATAYRVEASSWNSLVLARPAGDTAWERPATWVQASVEDATVGEGGGGAFAVTLTAALPHDVTVEWSLVEAGTAGGEDVTPGDGTATIPAGARTVDVPVPVLDDPLDEEDETFTIVLRDVSNGIRLDRSQATGTIVDDDAPPSVSVRPLTVVEGDTSLTDAAVVVELSAASGKAVSVGFATADGGAASPADYEAATGRLAFGPGERRAVLHLAVRGDAVAEPDEAFSVNLSEPGNATLGDASAAVTIADDEPLALVVTSPEVVEGDAGATPATFTVALEPAPPAGTTVSVDWAVEGATADVPGDAAAAGGTLVFGPGEGPKEVTVDVQGDLEVEPDERFRLVLSSFEASDGRTVLPGDAPLAVILDDDAGAPADSVAPTTTAVADPAAGDAGWHRDDVTVTLTATDEGGSGVASVSYRLGGAGTGEDTVAGAEAVLTVTAEGETTVTYHATDAAGNVEAERTLVLRIDRTAPTLACAASPGTLWPPDHRLVPVAVAVDVTDGGSGASGFVLAAVTSSEPDDAPGGGDGETTGDVQGFEPGTPDTEGLLRAERAGSGPGRTYALTYAGRDAALNEATCTATVTVPRDQR